MADTTTAAATPDATTGGYSPLTPAAVGGKRPTLRMVTKKVARKFLRKYGMKMRGGEDDPMAPTTAPAPTPSAGRRGKKSAKRSASTRRRRASAPFGF